jgi:hypothetical protein
MPPDLVILQVAAHCFYVTVHVTAHGRPIPNLKEGPATNGETKAKMVVTNAHWHVHPVTQKTWQIPSLGSH